MERGPMRGFSNQQARAIFICIAVVLLLGMLANATLRSEPEAVHAAVVIAATRVPAGRAIHGSRGIVTVRFDDGSVATIDIGRYALPRIGDRVRVERRRDLFGRRHLRMATVH
jgi:hypothetical protein